MTLWCIAPWAPALSLTGLCKGRWKYPFKPVECQSFALKVDSVISTSIITYFGHLQQCPEGEDWGSGTQRRGGERDFSIMKLAQMQQNDALLWLRMEVHYVG